MPRFLLPFSLAGLLMSLMLVVPPARAQPNASLPAIAYSGGDGSTIRKAIVIEGARSPAEGHAAELEWIRQNLPGATLQSQGRITGPPHYDVVTVRLASGAVMDLHFDITAFIAR
jgi:hypothetical protein